MPVPHPVVPEKRKPYPPEVRATAELLYVIEKRPREVAAEMAGITLSTLDRWRKAGDWDAKRDLQLIGIPHTVAMMTADVARTYKTAQEEDRPLTAGERDGVFKTLKMMTQLNKGALFASHGIQVMDLLSAYLAKEAPELREQLIPHIVDFTKRLVSA